MNWIFIHFNTSLYWLIGIKRNWRLAAALIPATAKFHAIGHPPWTDLRLNAIGYADAALPAQIFPKWFTFQFKWLINMANPSPRFSFVLYPTLSGHACDNNNNNSSNNSNNKVGLKETQKCREDRQKSHTHTHTQIYFTFILFFILIEFEGGVRGKKWGREKLTNIYSFFEPEIIM